MRKSLQYSRAQTVRPEEYQVRQSHQTLQTGSSGRATARPNGLAKRFLAPKSDRAASPPAEAMTGHVAAAVVLSVGVCSGPGQGCSEWNAGGTASEGDLVRSGGVGSELDRWVRPILVVVAQVF